MTRASQALRWTLGGGAALAWLAVIVLARTGVAGPGGGDLLAPVTAFMASLVQVALAWGGMDVLRHDALLYVPGGFAYEVAAGCTGILPATVIAAAILAAPASAAARRRGLAVAVPLVLAVNLLRLVHLFYLGVHAPRQFALAHTFLWEVGLVVFTLGTWLVWWQWARAQRTLTMRLRKSMSGASSGGMAVSTRWTRFAP